LAFATASTDALRAVWRTSSADSLLCAARGVGGGIKRAILRNEPELVARNFQRIYQEDSRLRLWSNFSIRVRLADCCWIIGLNGKHKIVA
jgi:hypothetical protein